jgi:hypothetical protein
MLRYELVWNDKWPVTQKKAPTPTSPQSMLFVNVYFHKCLYIYGFCFPFFFWPNKRFVIRPCPKNRKEFWQIHYTWRVWLIFSLVLIDLAFRTTTTINMSDKSSDSIALRILIGFKRKKQLDKTKTIIFVRRIHRFMDTIKRSNLIMHTYKQFKSVCVGGTKPFMT